MADEVKESGKSKGIKTFLKVLLGLALVVLGCFLIWKWFASLLLIIRGCLGLFLVFAGVITLAIAKE